MSDKREDILARLLAIYKTVVGVAKVARNEQVAEDWNFPALLLRDPGDDAEDAEDARSRPATAPIRVTMTPETYLILGELPETVGTELNRYRARIVKAVQAVSSEPVSGGWAPNSLFNREKTGNFSESGRYCGIFGRINSSNQ